jgi:uncharacterized protein (TIGR02270 family)
MSIEIHVQEAAGLYEGRCAQLKSAQIDRQALDRIDNRLAAHLDGLAVAGDLALPRIDAELLEPSAGTVFTAAVRAIEDGRTGFLDRLWSRAREHPCIGEGVTSALGWVEHRHVRGLVRELLTSADAVRRAAALAACAMHRVDPGLDVGPWLQDHAPLVRARALRMVGELGLQELASRCVAAIADDDAECQFWAAWSAVLLGREVRALEALCRGALDEHAPHRWRAFRLALAAMNLPAAHGLLQKLAPESQQRRWLIHGSGTNGDPAYVPWLIGHMANPATARLAGEAFTLVTGADLDTLQLCRPHPEDVVSGPSDDPDDENVDMDPDEGLMWPDPDKAGRWWDTNASRFQPGQRYFMGAPVTREHCVDVLKNGYQRQRILAAHYLCLLEPGTPLFNTSAPAWRQQTLLAQM